MKTLQVRNEQTLLDIAITAYGDAQGVYFLQEDNHLHSIIDNLQEGQTLYIRDTILHPEIVQRATYTPIVTADTYSRAQGIGFWEIHKDFIIS